MKRLLTGMALSAVLAAPAAAEVRYDVKLEKAVMKIVARKIGDIRGGFDYRIKPAFVVLPDPISTGSLKIRQGDLGEASIAERGPVRIISHTALRTVTF